MIFFPFEYHFHKYIWLKVLIALWLICEFWKFEIDSHFENSYDPKTNKRPQFWWINAEIILEIFLNSILFIVQNIILDYIIIIIPDNIFNNFTNDRSIFQ